MEKINIFEKLTGLKPNEEVTKEINQLNIPLLEIELRNLDKLLLHKINSLAEKVVNNETSFFRDKLVFSEILKLLPNINKIWSAGCSYGQEAYSLSMLLSKINYQTNFQIVATDISSRAVKVATSGKYLISRKDEIKRIQLFYPELLSSLDHYQDKTQLIEIDKNLKSRVSFFTHNLLMEFPKKDFDLILCRNVLIYMNKDARDKVFRNIENSLKPGGWLLMGSADPRPSSSHWKMYTFNDQIFWKYK